MSRIVLFNTHVQPICLPKYNEVSTPGTWCTVTGWGAQNGNHANGVATTSSQFLDTLILPLNISIHFCGTIQQTQPMIRRVWHPFWGRLQCLCWTRNSVETPMWPEGVSKRSWIRCCVPVSCKVVSMLAVGTADRHSPANTTIAFSWPVSFRGAMDAHRKIGPACTHGSMPTWTGFTKQWTNWMLNKWERGRAIQTN